MKGEDGPPPMTANPFEVCGTDPDWRQRCHRNQAVFFRLVFPFAQFESVRSARPVPDSGTAPRGTLRNAPDSLPL